MGVHGLWDLVAPAGTTCDLKSLSHQVVAVDASIWMFHFVKALRDKEGNMVPGAHVIGFFRRILRLLDLGIKPIFVFDGKPPEVKRKTLQQRQLLRDRGGLNLGKVTERLFRKMLREMVLSGNHGVAGGIVAEDVVDSDVEVELFGGSKSSIVQPPSKRGKNAVLASGKKPAAAGGAASSAGKPRKPAAAPSGEEELLPPSCSLFPLEQFGGSSSSRARAGTRAREELGRSPERRGFAFAETPHRQNRGVLDLADESPENNSSEEEPSSSEYEVVGDEEDDLLADDLPPKKRRRGPPRKNVAGAPKSAAPGSSGGFGRTRNAGAPASPQIHARMHNYLLNEGGHQQQPPGPHSAAMPAGDGSSSAADSDDELDVLTNRQLRWEKRKRERGYGMGVSMKDLHAKLDGSILDAPLPISEAALKKHLLKLPDHIRDAQDDETKIFRVEKEFLEVKKHLLKLPDHIRDAQDDETKIISPREGGDEVVLGVEKEDGRVVEIAIPLSHENVIDPETFDRMTPSERGKTLEVLLDKWNAQLRKDIVEAASDREVVMNLQVEMFHRLAKYNTMLAEVRAEEARLADGVFGVRSSEQGASASAGAAASSSVRVKQEPGVSPSSAVTGDSGRKATGGNEAGDGGGKGPRTFLGMQDIRTKVVSVKGGKKKGGRGKGAAGGGEGPGRGGEEQGKAGGKGGAKRRWFGWNAQKEGGPFSAKAEPGLGAKGEAANDQVNADVASEEIVRGIPGMEAEEGPKKRRRMDIKGQVVGRTVGFGDTVADSIRNSDLSSVFGADFVSEQATGRSAPVTPRRAHGEITGQKRTTSKEKSSSGRKRADAERKHAEWADSLFDEEGGAEGVGGFMGTRTSSGEKRVVDATLDDGIDFFGLGDDDEDADERSPKAAASASRAARGGADGGVSPPLDEHSGDMLGLFDEDDEEGGGAAPFAGGMRPAFPTGLSNPLEMLDALELGGQDEYDVEGRSVSVDDLRGQPTVDADGTTIGELFDGDMAVDEPRVDEEPPSPALEQEMDHNSSQPHWDVLGPAQPHWDDPFFEAERKNPEVPDFGDFFGEDEEDGDLDSPESPPPVPQEPSPKDPPKKKELSPPKGPQEDRDSPVEFPSPPRGLGEEVADRGGAHFSPLLPSASHLSSQPAVASQEGSFPAPSQQPQSPTPSKPPPSASVSQFSQFSQGAQTQGPQFSQFGTSTLPKKSQFVSAGSLSFSQFQVFDAGKFAPAAPAPDGASESSRGPPPPLKISAFAKAAAERAEKEKGISQKNPPNASTAAQQLNSVEQAVDELFGPSVSTDRAEATLADIRSELSRAKRDEEFISQDMYDEIKQILEAFGIPFLQAPSEAEAQCAFLVDSGQAHCCVTDDSDTIVFGGRTGTTNVYRHLFSTKGEAERYTATRINNQLGLHHEDFVAIAMLLGCDYTVGVKGIGIVNALEIVFSYAQEFLVVGPDGRYAGAAGGAADVAAAGAAASVGERPLTWLDCLRKLRQWAQDVANFDRPEHFDPTLVSEDFHVKHRALRPHWTFPEDFPSEEVWRAFAHPTIDHRTDKFHWTAVDEAEVVRLMGRYIPPALVERQLTPVLEKGEQLRREGLQRAMFDRFFVQEEPIAMVRSSRLRGAIDGLRRKKGLAVEAEAGAQARDADGTTTIGNEGAVDGGSGARNEGAVDSGSGAQRGAAASGSGSAKAKGRKAKAQAQRSSAKAAAVAGGPAGAGARAGAPVANGGGGDVADSSANGTLSDELNAALAEEAAAPKASVGKAVTAKAASRVGKAPAGPKAAPAAPKGKAKARPKKRAAAGGGASSASAASGDHGSSRPATYEDLNPNIVFPPRKKKK